MNKWNVASMLTLYTVFPIYEHKIRINGNLLLLSKLFVSFQRNYYVHHVFITVNIIQYEDLTIVLWLRRYIQSYIINTWLIDLSDILKWQLDVSDVKTYKKERKTKSIGLLCNPTYVLGYWALDYL